LKEAQTNPSISALGRLSMQALLGGVFVLWDTRLVFRILSNRISPLPSIPLLLGGEVPD
jgi:hypothetical protein